MGVRIPPWPPLFRNFFMFTLLIPLFALVYGCLYFIRWAEAEYSDATAIFSLFTGSVWVCSSIIMLRIIF